MVRWKVGRRQGKRYYGDMHASKTNDAEKVLREAIASYQAASSDQAARLARDVRKAAMKVLQARLKSFKKTRHVVARPTAADGPAFAAEMRQAEQRARDGGVNAILAEFGVESLIGPSTP